ncbi:hypothetical protein Taro_005587 [Colocasia esculenta]|uniref:Uncharacterized protein n=1 Tax=Colocasia esculenta TaxID=4460 RepID=A0A843TYA1_COLES|nr:hypothetical protein [Colocasia esculenta]
MMVFSNLFRYLLQALQSQGLRYAVFQSVYKYWKKKMQRRENNVSYLEKLCQDTEKSPSELGGHNLEANDVSGVSRKAIMPFLAVTLVSWRCV